MSDILRTAVGGLNDAASRIARATNFIVNASSTSENSTGTTKNVPTTSANTTITDPQDLTTALVSIKSDSVAYGADAAVVKVKKNLDNALLNIIA